MSGKFISACGSVGVFAAVCVCVYFGQRTCKYLLCLSSAKKGEKSTQKNPETNKKASTGAS